MVETNRQGAEAFYKMTTSAGIESKSGPGSFLANKAELREALLEIFEKYEIKSRIHCPGGDWNWMRYVNLD